MFPPKNPSKPSAMLVSAIRNLRNAQGSSSREIINYITSAYDGPSKNLKRDVKVALRRGISNGILRRSKNGCYFCTARGAAGPADAGCCRRRPRRKSCKRKRKKRCGKKRRRPRGCKRKKKKCSGRRRLGDTELDAFLGAYVASYNQAKRARGESPDRQSGPRSRGASKTASEARSSTASSVATQDSAADTNTPTGSVSGKDSLSDQSDATVTSEDTNAGKKAS